jgi:hypothetical protein
MDTSGSRKLLNSLAYPRTRSATGGRDGMVTEHRHPMNNYGLYKKSDLTRLLRRAEKSRA